MGAQSPPLKRARTGVLTSKNSNNRAFSSPTGDTHHDTDKQTHSALQIHECSFIKWHVSGITSVAATPSGRYLAVARTNGTLELRDKNAIWATVSIQYVRQTESENVITSMAFSNSGGFLFVANLVGTVDIFRLTPDGLSMHTTLRPGGGAVWGIAVNRALEVDLRIAIANDDGRVRIITPDPLSSSIDPKDPYPSDPVHYEITASEKTAARVLSLCWSQPSPAPEDACIVCGDDEGGIRWLKASSGSSFGKGKIPTTRGQKVMIWTVQVASEGQEVVCGDSRGIATVWSSLTNTMNTEARIEGIQGALWSSVLISEDTGTEFVLLGGAGGGVGAMKKGGKDESWTPIRAVRLHTHDVRDMCPLSDGMLLSGSMDSQMRTFSPTSLVKKKRIDWIRPYNECVGQQPIQFCPSHGIVVTRLKRSVELWSLTTKARHPSLLLRMNINGIPGELRACALSRDCRSLALSAPECFKLYRICDTNHSEAAISSSFGKVVPVDLNKSLLPVVSGCVDMSFGDHFLACVSFCRKKVALIAGDSYHLSNIDEFGAHGVAISRLACTKDAVAVSDTRGNVYKCQIQNKSIDKAKTLEWVRAFSCRKPIDYITALAFSDSGKKLGISTASRRVCVLDVESKSNQEFDLNGNFSSCAQSMSFSKSEKSVLISGRDFCVLCAVEISLNGKRKRKKQTASKSIHILPFRDSIIGTSVMGPSRIAVVTREWHQVLPSLSVAIPKKVYGT